MGIEANWPIRGVHQKVLGITISPFLGWLMRRHSMPSFLDRSHTCRNMCAPMCRAIWRPPLPWPSVWRSTGVETGPRQVEEEKDPKDSKIKNRKRAL